MSKYIHALLTKKTKVLSELFTISRATYMIFCQSLKRFFSYLLPLQSGMDSFFIKTFPNTHSYRQCSKTHLFTQCIHIYQCCNLVTASASDSVVIADFMLYLLHAFPDTQRAVSSQRHWNNKPPTMAISVLSSDQAISTTTANDRQPMTSYSQLSVTTNHGSISVIKY